MTSFWDACPIFVSAKQYELTRTVGQWLTPIVCKRLAEYELELLDNNFNSRANEQLSIYPS